MERSLPYIGSGVDLTYLPGHMAFVLAENVGKGDTFPPENDDRVDMVGHDHIFIDYGMGEMLRDVQKRIPGDFSQGVKGSRFSQNTLFIVGADGDKVIVRGGVVKVFQACPFANRVFFTVVHGENPFLR